MAICPNCGRKRFGLQARQCVGCGRSGCDECLSSFGHVWRSDGKSVPRYVCSWDCFDGWARPLVRQGYGLDPAGSRWALTGVVLGEAYGARVREDIETHTRSLQIAYATNLIEAERFEDAAKVYERFKMWKEAGEARRMGRRATTTQVQVDLNELVRQMREGGLTTTYTCPACKSPIQITGDMPTNALRSCSYCGTVLQATDLMDFLRRVVG